MTWNEFKNKIDQGLEYAGLDGDKVQIVIEERDEDTGSVTETRKPFIRLREEKAQISLS